MNEGYYVMLSKLLLGTKHTNSLLLGFAVNYQYDVNRIIDWSITFITF